MTLQVLALVPLEIKISAAQAALLKPIMISVERDSVLRTITEPLLDCSAEEKSVQKVTWLTVVNMLDEQLAAEEVQSRNGSPVKEPPPSVYNPSVLIKFWLQFKRDRVHEWLWVMRISTVLAFVYGSTGFQVIVPP
jgi:hypothetical protein